MGDEASKTGATKTDVKPFGSEFLEEIPVAEVPAGGGPVDPLTKTVSTEYSGGLDDFAYDTDTF